MDVKVKVNPVESQYLLIQIVKSLSYESVGDIISELKEKENKNEINSRLNEYILMCISFGIEISKNPEYCSTFDLACKTIIKRQKKLPDEIKIHKKDYIEKLGWKNGVQLNRIEKGKSIMQVESIETICSGFEKELDQLFWKNYLLTFFGKTQYINYDSTTEYEALKEVVGILCENDYQLLEGTMQEEDFIKICRIRQEEDLPVDPFGEPPFQLYRVISHLVDQMPSMTIESLIEDELWTSRTSWYIWKTNWDEAERENFRMLPEPRIQRKHLLVIAIVFKLEYIDMIRLLHMGGYRLGMDSKDREIASYFLKSRDSLDELKVRILRDEI